MSDNKLPDNFLRFTKTHPEIYAAFEELGRRLHESGPLSERERRLVKLGIAVGLGTEGGVHSAVRFANAGGCSRTTSRTSCASPSRQSAGLARSRR